MNNLDEMRNHYRYAGMYYEAVKNQPDDRNKKACQDRGGEEYAKAEAAAEAEKKEIRKEASNKAGELYDKQDEAYKKGDYKKAKEYQEQGDKVMEEAKEKENAIEEEQQKLASEARSKMDGLERRH